MDNDIALDPARLENVQRREDGSIIAACPACRASGSDKSGNHLKIEQSGKFGCAANPGDGEHRKEIFRLAGIKTTQKPAASRIVATYDYHDASGKLLFQAVRKDPKDFLQRQPDGKGGWTWNLKGVEMVLFRLPEILHAVAKGNASGKDAIDRISGSGVFARDPDALLIFTKHESDAAFTVEPILRNFAPVEPFAVRWEFPLMQLAADLDPAKLKQAGGRKPTYQPDDLLPLLPPDGLTNADWLAKADGEGMSKPTFYRMRKALETSGKIHHSAITGKWQPILTK
jgi:hypothetical protein